MSGTVLVGAYWLASLVGAAFIGIYGWKNGWPLSATVAAGFGFPIALGLLIIGVLQ